MMNECCKENFKRALEQVVFAIKTNKPESLQELLGALEYAISLLN